MQLTYSPGFPLLRVACTVVVVVGKAGVVSVVSTTSGDASPPCVRDPASVPSTDPTWVPPPPPPNAGAAVSTGALPLQLPSPPLQLRGSFSRLPTTGQRARPQKREKGFHRRGILGEGDMLLLPSQTVDPAATATPYSDATQVGFSY